MKKLSNTEAELLTEKACNVYLLWIDVNYFFVAITKYVNIELKKKEVLNFQLNLASLIKLIFIFHGKI